MRPLIGALALIAAWFASSLPSVAASIVAYTGLSEQRTDVCIDGFPNYRWPVSTARVGYPTAVGRDGMENT
jgi:hypothetical protein